MRSSLFAAALVAGLAQADTEWPEIDLDQFEELTFQNYIDHSNYLDRRMYDQRYWVSDQYWDGDGPIFIYICGEYRCSLPSTRLFPFMVGAMHNARFMVLEHRFYGESQPFDSWELDNLGYLTAEQALADLAYFIGSMNPDHKNEVLVIGGSYPGAMSAWFRNRYPHLTVGSWASSAVVEAIYNIWQMDDQTYDSAVRSGTDCTTTIQQSMAYVSEQGSARDNGVTDTIIDQTLQSTDSEGMNTGDWYFYYSDIFLESVQYGNRTSMCQMLADNAGASQDEIVRLSTEFGTNVANVNPGDYDRRKIADTTIDTYSSARPWTYQYCTEFGFFQVPSEIDGHVMRPLELADPYWFDMCHASFGDSLPLAQVDRTIPDLGGWDIGGTNIFFSNGVEDPWKWAGQMESKPQFNQVARVVDCENCGHCVDLYTPSDDDSQNLKDARQEIMAWVDGILSGPKKQAPQLIQ